jgi:hypothetical protein
MKENKMTYVDALTVAIDCVTLPEDVREKLDALRAQQMKRNSAEKKPTKTQQENEVLKSAMVDAMLAHGEKVTIKELMTLMKLDPLTVSPQKVSALMTQMVKAGTVAREEVKHVAYFSAVEG